MMNTFITVIISVITTTIVFSIGVVVSKNSANVKELEDKVRNHIIEQEIESRFVQRQIGRIQKEIDILKKTTKKK